MERCLKEGWIVKYVQRYSILELATEGFISSKEGAKALNISKRRFKCLKKKFRKLGQKALIHGNHGHTPPNVYPEKIKQKVLHLFRSQYHNFNISHFTDILKEEYGINVSKETVRSWLIKAGLLELKPP